MPESQVQWPTPLDPDGDDFPRRSELPHIPGAPEGAAWLWGEHDELGRINLLTPRRVLAAKDEIKAGEVIPLDLPLDEPSPPLHGRQLFAHTIIAAPPTLGKGAVYDDAWTLNTQSSSQWDGFLHFSCTLPSSGESVWYNNIRASNFHLSPSSPSPRCSISAVAEHGLVARALLLDVYGYALSHGIPLDPLQSQPLPLSLLAACGRAQGLDIFSRADVPPGCVLLVRTGFVARLRELGADRSPNLNTFAGLEQSSEMLDWLHDSWWVGVASDNVALEVWPPGKDTEGGREGWTLHEYLLPRWGVMVGELWDLERLAEKCRGWGRWWCCLVSTPANVKSGVASVANAVAIL